MIFTEMKTKYYTKELTSDFNLKKLASGYNPLLIHYNMKFNFYDIYATLYNKTIKLEYISYIS